MRLRVCLWTWSSGAHPLDILNVSDCESDTSNKCGDGNYFVGQRLTCGLTYISYRSQRHVSYGGPYALVVAGAAIAFEENGHRSPASVEHISLSVQTHSREKREGDGGDGGGVYS